MGGPFGVGNQTGVAPVTPQTTQKTGKHAPVNGRPIGGRTPTFLKEIAKSLAGAFKAIGKRLSKLGPRQGTTVNQGMTAGKAIDRYFAAKAAQKANASDPAARAAKNDARKEMVAALRKELGNSPLMQAALHETKQDVLHNKDALCDKDVQVCLDDALDNLLTNRESAIEEARTRGLPVDQLVALHLYTTRAYAGVNSELRGGQPCAFCRRADEDCL